MVQQDTASGMVPVYMSTRGFLAKEVGRERNNGSHMFELVEQHSGNPAGVLYTYGTKACLDILWLNSDLKKQYEEEIHFMLKLAPYTVDGQK